MAVKIVNGKEIHVLNLRLAPETKAQLVKLSKQYKVPQTVIIQRACIWYGVLMDQIRKEKGLKY